RRPAPGTGADRDPAIHLALLPGRRDLVPLGQGRRQRRGRQRRRRHLRPLRRRTDRDPHPPRRRRPLRHQQPGDERAGDLAGDRRTVDEASVVRSYWRLGRVLTQDGCRGRQERLRALLEREGIGAALISDPRDVYYLTGFLAPGVPPFPVLLYLQTGGRS